MVRCEVFVGEGLGSVALGNEGWPQKVKGKVSRAARTPWRVAGGAAKCGEWVPGQENAELCCCHELSASL